MVRQAHHENPELAKGYILSLPNDKLAQDCLDNLAAAPEPP